MDRKQKVFKKCIPPYSLAIIMGNTIQFARYNFSVNLENIVELNYETKLLDMKKLLNYGPLES